MFFELYDNGSLVHTSSDLASASLTFLASGYGGLVDEVRVFTVANGGTIGSLMTPGGSAWIMDNVTFEDLSTPVPEPATLLLFATGLAAGAWRKRRPR